MFLACISKDVNASQIQMFQDTIALITINTFIIGKKHTQQFKCHTKQPHLNCPHCGAITIKDLKNKW